MTITRFEDMFSVMTYPAGEPHVQLGSFTYSPDYDRKNYIVAGNVRDFNDLGLVITAHRILEHKGLAKYFEWVIPYFPFARHDRRNHSGDGMELQLAIEMIKPLNPIIVDPHSDVSAIFRYVPQYAVVRKYMELGFMYSHAVVAIPDAGAIKKASTWTGGKKTVQCMKHRDPTSGRLDGFQVLGEIEPGAPVVIVDDICDGGGTFLGLARALRDAGAGHLTLAVTHGLFTKGLQELNIWFDRIVTLDTTTVSGVNTVPLDTILYEGNFL